MPGGCGLYRIEFSKGRRPACRAERPACESLSKSSDRTARRSPPSGSKTGSDPGVTQASAYLPLGRWVHLWSGQTYGDTNNAGGYVSVPAPLGQPGVFYPEGSPVAAQFIENLKAAGIL